jgi:hypothetical protein
LGCVIEDHAFFWQEYAMVPIWELLQFIPVLNKISAYFTYVIARFTWQHHGMAQPIFIHPEKYMGIQVIQ